jgi:hypothetical protein
MILSSSRAKLHPREEGGGKGEGGRGKNEERRTKKEERRTKREEGGMEIGLPLCKGDRHFFPGLF